MDASEKHLALALFSEYTHEQLLGDLGEDTAFLVDVALLDLRAVTGSCGSSVFGC